MFLKGKRGNKNFMKMFILEWKMFFKELGDTLGNLWRKHCPMCICKYGKEKKNIQLSKTNSMTFIIMELMLGKLQLKRLKTNIQKDNHVARQSF